MINPLLFALLAAAPAGPVVEDIGNGQFRIVVSKRGLGADQILQATAETMEAAERVCRGHGTPVEIGRGEIVVNRGGGLQMVSIYACRASG